MCYEAKRRDEMWCCASIVALFCPPLAVLLMTGCSIDFLLNCLLTFLIYIPGFLHAYCIIYCPDRIDPDKKHQMTEAACRHREQEAMAEAAAAAAAQEPSPPPIPTPEPEPILPTAQPVPPNV